MIDANTDIRGCSKAELTAMYLDGEITAVCYFNLTGISPPDKRVLTAEYLEGLEEFVEMQNQVGKG